MCATSLTPQPLPAYPRYETHETVLQAIHEQEQQMQVLSDIIPGDDALACVHACTCPFAHARSTHMHVRARTHTNHKCTHTSSQTTCSAHMKVSCRVSVYHSAGLSISIDSPIFITLLAYTQINMFASIHCTFRCMYMYVHLDMHIVHIHALIQHRMVH